MTSLVKAFRLGIDCALLHFIYPSTAKASQEFNASNCVHCLLNTILINATWYPVAGQSLWNTTSSPVSLYVGFEAGHTSLGTVWGTK